MKHLKKFVAMLLVSVMALTMLTACGGGGGGSNAPTTPQAQLAAKVNEKLKTAGMPTVTYSTRMDDKLDAFMDYCITNGVFDDIDSIDEETAAEILQMSGLDDGDYDLEVVTSASDLNTVAGIFATRIIARDKKGKVVKQIGFSAYTAYGEDMYLALLKY